LNNLWRRAEVDALWLLKPQHEVVPGPAADLEATPEERPLIRYGNMWYD